MENIPSVSPGDPNPVPCSPDDDDDDDDDIGPSNLPVASRMQQTNSIESMPIQSNIDNNQPKSETNHNCSADIKQVGHQDLKNTVM